MPLVGNNQEPLRETANFIYNGTLWVPMQSDASGYLEVVTPDLSDIEARGYGWINADWQKNPLAFGYSGDQSEEKSNLSAVAGNNLLSGTTVPSGEIWNIQAIGAINATSAIPEIDLQVSVNGITVTLLTKLTPAAGEWVSWSSIVTLSEGDYVRARFVTCVLNDDIYLTYHGITIDIDQ